MEFGRARLSSKLKLSLVGHAKSVQSYSSNIIQTELSVSLPATLRMAIRSISVGHVTTETCEVARRVAKFK